MALMASLMLAGTASATEETPGTTPEVVTETTTETETPPVEETTSEVFWSMPNGGNPDNVTWAQTYSPNGAVECDVWYQVDLYHDSDIPALTEDGILTQGEDAGVVISWTFVYGGDCAVVEPPVEEEPPVVIEPPVVVEPPVVIEPPVVVEPPVIETPPVVDTPAPPVVETPVAVETPPVVEAPVVVAPPVVVEEVAQPVDTNETLAYTGTNSILLGGVALALLVAGGVITVAARKRA